ncbi:D-arabinono-1,4-lactone oxidase-domain-containing protein [Ephemerocybe angulata]|uniref:D-arabinono-1,4-lactone oxidase n=1 Tax=Ephemerocybe angulata TaxID=980116 RepID=A0A8H6M3F6_9AGAR|nr:D-arabinono-1,4-lactone oxidase-domain-containing protein [Tulosesus angulatus]
MSSLSSSYAGLSSSSSSNSSQPTNIDDERQYAGASENSSSSRFAGRSTEELYKSLQAITVPSSSPRATFSNWAKTYFCKPLAVFEPTNVEECAAILELARREGKVVRAVGVGHSPSDLAFTNEFMIRMTRMNKMLEISTEKQYFKAEAGITLEDLHGELARYNLAFSCLGSISEQTLGGIITTATHGTGITFPVICKAVTELQVLLADGSQVVCSRTQNSDIFNATLSGIGATGIILTVTMSVEPAFRLKEYQETLPIEEFVGSMHKLLRSAQHPRFWWFPAAGTVRCCYANRTTEALSPGGNWFYDRLVGYHAIQLLLFGGRFVRSLNIWAGRLAAWLATGKTTIVNQSHRIFNVDCRYPQHTTEWAVPLRNAEACIREFRTWIEGEISDPSGIRPHFPIEVRFSAGDDLWMSPSHSEETCWIGIVQFKPYGFNVPYHKYFAHFEQVVFKHGGRPHWAKAHEMKPDDLRRLYPRFDDFRGVLEKVDPKGMFRNEYVRRHILGEDIDLRVFKPTKSP